MGVVVPATYVKLLKANVCGECNSEIKIERHPTQKPVELMRWLVKLVTPPGGLVLDPFTGSGSTGVACKAEGFRFLGVEQDEAFVALARERIETWVEGLPVPAVVSKDQLVFEMEEI